VLSASPLAVAAAPSDGLAYDSVVKYARGDVSSLQPGSFQQDFDAAAAPAPDLDPANTDLGGLVGNVGSLALLVQKGIAVRFYATASKERIDTPALQSGTIVDCTDHTLTKLDFGKKTFRTVPIAATAAPPGRGGPSVAFTFENTSLGTKTIDDLPADGYSSKVHVVVGGPKQSQQTVDMDMTAYYSAYDQPVSSCHSSAMAGMLGPAGNDILQRALEPSSSDASGVQTTGPRLPAGKLLLFGAVTVKDIGLGGGVMVMERGNIRKVADDDPIFSVPAGFTKLP
jgi:hypothetical protein